MSVRGQYAEEKSVVQQALLVLSCKKNKQSRKHRVILYDMKEKKIRKNRRHMAAHMVLHLLLPDASHLIDLLIIRPCGWG